MPGTGIAGFQRKAVEIAVAGIYDLRQHRDDVVVPVLRYWKVFERRRASTPTASRPATELAELIGGPRDAPLRFEEKRDARAARLAPAEPSPTPPTPADVQLSRRFGSREPPFPTTPLDQLSSGRVRGKRRQVEVAWATRRPRASVSRASARAVRRPRCSTCPRSAACPTRR